jgi:hypothetical protein
MDVYPVAVLMCAGGGARRAAPLRAVRADQVAVAAGAAHRHLLRPDRTRGQLPLRRASEVRSETVVKLQCLRPIYSTRRRFDRVVEDQSETELVAAQAAEACRPWRC